MGFGRALPLFVNRLVGETNGPIRQIRTVMEQFLRIGVITQAHGIRGEVKVYPTTDSPERFKEVKRVIIQSKKGEIETEIKGVKFFKNMAIVQFACFDSPEEASKYRQADVMIYREDAQPLEEGEYYIADLLGCSVLLDEESVPVLKEADSSIEIDSRRCIGTIKDVLQTGANDVYIVNTGKKELLIPVIKDCILNVDIERGEIQVHLLPGLI